MSRGAADVVAISRRELEDLVGRLDAAEQEIAGLRKQVATAEEEAEKAIAGFLFEMRFDEAVRRRRIPETERPAWREAWVTDRDAVEEALGFEWRWAA